MSLTLLVIAAVAVVNAPRVRTALPRVETVLIAGVGAALTWAVLVPLAALADAAIDGAAVASSTLRMATGLVLVLQGGLAFVTGAPRAEPSLPGRRAALVPVAFPVLLTPGLALLTVSGALDRAGPQTVAVMAGALAMVPLIAFVRVTPVTLKVLDGLGRLTGAVLLLSGLALLMNGVFDI